MARQRIVRGEIKGARSLAKLNARSILSSVRLLIVPLCAAFVLTACAYATPNPIPPYYDGQGGPGDPTINRAGYPPMPVPAYPTYRNP
jgi:hypothetical protein